MKKIFILFISSIYILFTSCGKKITEEEEMSNFISQIGQDSTLLLSDSSLVISKINQWKTTLKSVKSEYYTLSDGITSIKKVNITMHNDRVILLRFYFIGKSLLRINIFPLGDNKALWDTLVSRQEIKYKKVGLNTWEMDNKFKLTKVVYNDGYTNNNWSMDAVPEDSPNYLQISVDLENAYAFYSQKINPYLSNNKSDNLFFLDFKNGTVKVPDGKVWVIRKSENYVADDMEFGIFDTTKTCHCFLKGGLESTTFLMINGECIRLGTLSPGYDRSIFTPGTSICIPNAEPLLNKDNGKRQYLFYNQVFIQEFNIKDIPNFVDLSEQVKSMGFNEDDFLYIKYLNYLTAIEKPKNPFD